MTDPSSTTRILQGLLDRLRAGDEKARDDLIGHACSRLMTLTHKMFGRFSRLRAWEQTEDVAQNAMMRLRRALIDVQPTTVREFFGLASVQIRRELLDLSRHYFGREGSPADGDVRVSPNTPHLVSQAATDKDDSRKPADVSTDEKTYDSGNLEVWRKFHEAVAKLPDLEREAAELLWYQELTQEEAAEILGVDKSTVKRRWRSARLKLGDVLKDLLPKDVKSPD